MHLFDPLDFLAELGDCLRQLYSTSHRRGSNSFVVMVCTPRASRTTGRACPTFYNKCHQVGRSELPRLPTTSNRAGSPSCQWQLQLPPTEAHAPDARERRHALARLLARVYEVDPLVRIRSDLHRAAPGTAPAASARHSRRHPPATALRRCHSPLLPPPDARGDPSSSGSRSLLQSLCVTMTGWIVLPESSWTWPHCPTVGRFEYALSCTNLGMSVKYWRSVDLEQARGGFNRVTRRGRRRKPIA